MTFPALDHVSSCSSDAGEGKQRQAWPPLLAIGSALLFVFLRPDILELEGGAASLQDEFAEAEQTISHVGSLSEAWKSQGSWWSGTARGLRGACGTPVEFRWVFPDAGHAIGKPMVSRIVAVDSAGRPACPSSCAALKVNVSFTSGSARLSKPTEWQGAQILMDIENDVAETVDATMRIEGPGAIADALLYSSRMSFVAGPVHKLSFRLLPTGLSGKIASNESRKQHVWPAGTVLDVVLVGEDKFGNVIEIPENTKTLAIYTSSQKLKVKSFLQYDSKYGDSRAQVQAVRAGTYEIWVAHDGRGTTAEKERFRTLRDDTLQVVDFIGPASESPEDWQKTKDRPLSAADKKWQSEASRVRDAFLHAWDNYKTHAWGTDELKPLSKKGHDVFGNIGMTMIDSLTTMWMMGLPEQFDEAASYIASSLDFNNCHRGVSVFEIVIRALGGLLGAHALSGRQVFADKAKDLGERLLGAFNSTSGLPYPRWNIGTRKATEKFTEPTILAEAGSVQLEFRVLTAVTGDRRFREAADRSSAAIEATGVEGLMPVHLTPPDHTPVRAMNDKIQMGALADSYYEYLLKQWVQSPSETRYKKQWLKVMDELPMMIFPAVDDVDDTASGGLKIIERTPDGNILFKMDHLSCFTPGMVALGIMTVPQEEQKKDWKAMAEGLTKGCAELWTHTKTGLAPEYAPVKASNGYKFGTAPDGAKHSFLRPETAESLFYLYRLTGDEQYRKLGKKMFDAIMKHAKVPGGFASVQDVEATKVAHMDEMQSFVMAETFKYLYLLFSPADVLDLGRYVLNTEAHPLIRVGPW